MMTRRIGGVLAGMLLSAVSATALAAEGRTVAESPDQVDQALARYNLYPAFEKLGRGVGNALMGWAEIPLGVHDRYSAEDTGTSIITGLALGLFKGVARTGVGLYEAVTFLLPYPEDFRPILPPLEYFRRRGGKAHKPLPLE